MYGKPGSRRDWAGHYNRKATRNRIGGSLLCTLAFLLWLLLAFSPLLFLVGWPNFAYAAGPVIDPAADPILTTTCTPPTHRTDGTPLAPGELASIEIFIDTDPAADPAQHAGQAATCPVLIDVSGLPNGQYYKWGKATDTAGTQSARSLESVPFVIKKTLAAPLPPTGVN